MMIVMILLLLLLLLQLLLIIVLILIIIIRISRPKEDAGYMDGASFEEICLAMDKLRKDH